MPSIEISQDQAAALARGENIKIEPARKLRPYLAYNENAVCIIEYARPRVGHSAFSEGVSGVFSTVWVRPGGESLAGGIGHHACGSFSANHWTLVELG